MKPDIDLLTRSLTALIRDGSLPVDMEYTLWQSGVYSLVDCIFSSQARYFATVVPMLERRLHARPGLQDDPQLTFSAFLADVDSFGTDKIERYAREVLTRQVLAGRRKVIVCYEAAQFFVERGLETIADFRALDTVAQERLILEDLRSQVRGFGEALSRYLLMRLGSPDHIKPDVMMVRFFTRLSDWTPRVSDNKDAEVMREVLRAVAPQFSLSIAQLDGAIWLHESQRKR